MSNSFLDDVEGSDVTTAQAENLADSEGFFKKSDHKGQGLYFLLFDGTLCLKSDTMVGEGWEGPIPTQNPRTKEWKDNYVLRYDRLVGRLVDVYRQKKEFPGGSKLTNWNFVIMAGGKKGILQTVWCDRLLSKFLKVAPNIDFERPILFGAFKKMENGVEKQLISIRQGEDSDPKNWAAVPYYWRKAIDPTTKQVDMTSPARGNDGTIMPDPTQDPDDDSWDFKPQERFLAKHFTENTLPKIKAIAERLGIKHEDVTSTAEGETSTPAFTGPAIPVVTEKPENPESTSLKDAMTPDQALGLRKLAKRVDIDPDKLSNKILGVDFDDLSIDGAAYLKHRIEKKIKKAQAEDPNAYPDPEASKLLDAIQKQKASAAVEEDEDDWDAATAPKSAVVNAGNDDINF